MQNDQGQNVELYTPRKCSATNRIITAKDAASVQINIAQLDSNGVFQGDSKTVAFSGFVRFHSNADEAMNRLAAAEGLMKDLGSFPAQHKFKE
jgi:small subunit ribosomal protein S21e